MPSLLDARRTAAALVAVALSAALIVFAFIVSDSFTAQLTADARASVGDADVVVLPQRGEDLPESTAQNIAAACYALWNSSKFVRKNIRPIYIGFLFASNEFFYG